MKRILYLFSTIALISICGCTKDFLDAKPSTSILQPTTLEEFQSLLDNYNVNNMTSGMGILSADEHQFYSDAVWLSARTATERNAYIWAKDLYEGEISEDWNRPYTAIFYANNVLKGLEDIEITAINSSQYNKTKGWALFVRAFAYYELTNNFAPIYDPATAAIDLGVPLRLKPSIDELMPRATVKENFDRILADLAQASQLLEVQLPANRNRPSRIAAHALFARIYLQRREYNIAERHADTCLSLYNKLVDYNTLSKTSTAPFSTTHDELIYSKYSITRASAAQANTFIKIAPEQIGFYESNDLRLTMFYVKQTDGSYRMKRAYHGNGLYPFVGLATDEVYLIKAECLARKGDVSAAMDVLNQLLVKRWDPAATTPAKPFQAITATSFQDAVNKVMLERRKELVWRGLRWDDLKRLNKEGANITLTRTVNGNTYSLPPNSPKYVFPIPDDEIGLSGIQQNLR